MTFDKPTRSKLARMVDTCRRLLTDDIRDQIQVVYGIQPDGTALPVDKLRLDDQQRETAVALRQWLDHLAAGETDTGKEGGKNTFLRMAHETAFTYLNRLAALRMCEEREHVIECVRRGVESDGFAMYERLANHAQGDRGDTYRAFLECMFDELALDLGVLFDRRDRHSLVFPRHSCIESVLQTMNAPELTHLWKEDETIGWVYQYFNSKDERERMRKGSQAPSNSRELAVLNQFFTPRYVVEFLTDNTLGRIWYEMRKGQTNVRDQCPYLVCCPNEVFLSPNETAPNDQENEPGVSQHELLQRTVYIEHRAKKDPRDLRILDPACGSGHFLLYAFDVLEQIYEEAWADPNAPKSEATGNSLAADYDTVDAMRRDVPRLILQYNLHGIDIDPRAVQIAALALWMRAQKTWKTLGLRAGERPRIVKSNIVTAEPMPGEEEMLRDFLTGLQPRVLGQLVEVVFQKMKLADEAGSLLKIEQEIKGVIAKAAQQWRDGPKPERQLLFPDMFETRPKQLELRFQVKEITEERFWFQAEDRILDKLEDYAKAIEASELGRRRLFAEDVARGFALIDLSRKKYDVVLMNPPFGESSEKTARTLSEQYSTSARNLLCAFIERAMTLCDPTGKVGAIYDRTANIKTTYEDFRRAWLLSFNSSIQIGLDLGWGVLDEANVETTCSTLSRESCLGAFFDVRDVPVESKQSELSAVMERLGTGRSASRLHLLKTASFGSLPNAAISPDLPIYLISAFGRACSLKQAGFQAYSGYTLKADQHNRLWWEIDPHRPPPFSMSMFNGAGFEPYTVSLVEYVVSHCAPECLPPGTTTFIRNRAIQGMPGLCFGKRGDYFCAHLVPAGFLFTQEGRPLPVADRQTALKLLGFLNTPLFRHGLNTYCGQHKTSGYVNVFPFLQFPSDRNALDKLELAVARRMAVERTCETDRRFVSLPVVKTLSSSYVHMAEQVEKAIEATISAEESWEKVVEDVYSVDRIGRANLQLFRESQPSPGITTPWLEVGHAGFAAAWLSYCVGLTVGRFDVRLITGNASDLPVPDPFASLPLSPPGMLTTSDGLPASVIPNDYPLDVPTNGILIDDPQSNDAQPHREDVVRRIRDVFALIWRDNWHEIEPEACEMLGVSALRDYFRKPSGFFQDHLKRYSKSRRKAPIYWPLSTASGSYTVWLYYHRLTDQTPYTIVNKYLEPKITDLQRMAIRIEEELSDVAGSMAATTRESLSNLRMLAQDLEDMKQELLRIAALPYRPNLNDGVIINAAPLYKLFRHRSWANECEQVWKKLEAGDYDWSHMAGNIWPNRVREKCGTDRSLAIAHGLEEICQVPPPGERKRRGRKKK